jgi:hypothetical protein
MRKSMRIPGPYSYDTWSWPPEGRKDDRVPKESNRLPQVIWEMGIVLAVPLMGAALVELLLRSFGVH